MASRGYLQAAALLVVVLLCLGAAEADQDKGTVIPAESRPCVDCHAFEFMQRALQDLKKTAFNLDARTETLVLRAERRALCDCMPIGSLGWGHPTNSHSPKPLMYTDMRLIYTIGTLFSFTVKWSFQFVPCLIWDVFYTTNILDCGTRLQQTLFYITVTFSNFSSVLNEIIFSTL